jgi:hypothetical protein
MDTRINENINSPSIGLCKDLYVNDDGLLA